MSVGMPGAAVGGLFYIVSAICMPVRESLSRRQGETRSADRWRAAVRQAAIALGIITVTWLVGVLLALFVEPAPMAQPASAVHPSRLAAACASHSLQHVAVILSLGTLASILVGVQLLRLVVRQRPLCRPKETPCSGIR